MKVIGLRLTLSMLVFFFIGCGVSSIQQTMPTAITPSPSSGEDNQYYYFTAAQIERRNGNLDNAIILLRKAIAIDPTSAYLQRELATVYLQNKEDQKALKVLDDLLVKDPNDIKSLIIYGGIRQVRKETKETIETYEKIIALDPKQEKIYSMLGSLLMEAGDLKRAKAVFYKQIENFPTSYTGHFFLGRIFIQQDDIKQAEVEFKKALDLAPDRLEPKYELIDLYKKQGKIDAVIQLHEDILEMDPDNIRAAIELSYYYHQQGREKEAEKMLFDLGLRSQNEFEIIITIIQLYIDPKNYDDALIILEGMLKAVPESSELNHLAGIAHYGLKNNDRAIMHFRRVLPESRFFQDAVIHIAFIYQEKGENESAIEFLTSAVDKDPNNADFKYYLGTFYEEAEDFDQAERLMKEAIELEPDNPRYHFRLGVIYDKWNKKDASMETMQKVIALDPKHANALNYLGYTYADLGVNLDEAERLIREALKYKPDDGYITDSLGWVYYKKGMFQDALKYLKKAVQLVPDDPIILEHLGDTYLKLNDKKSALEFYQKSLKVKEKDKEALEEKIRQLMKKGS